MLIAKDYCDRDTCVVLNELGCPITKWISGDVVSTFTLYKAQKWLRDEKGIIVCPIYDKNTSKWFCSIINADSLKSFNTMRFDSYEEVLLEGIKEAIKLLKEEKGVLAMREIDFNRETEY